MRDAFGCVLLMSGYFFTMLSYGSRWQRRRPAFALLCSVARRVRRVSVAGVREVLPLVP